MTKKALRNIYKEKRKLLTASEIARYTDLILINFQKISLPPVSCVHTYMAMHDKIEIDTQHIIGYLQFRNPGLHVCIPKMNATTGQLQNVLYTDETDLITNLYGIEEPAAGEKIDAKNIDLVLAPLLAFDANGNRVGYGKGLYDNFFLQCRNDVIKIGLSFFEATENIEDDTQVDIPLNYCVTPKQVYTF